MPKPKEQIDALLLVIEQQANQIAELKARLDAMDAVWPQIKENTNGAD